jgi:hypothetical protein
VSVQALAWLAEECPDLKPHLVPTMLGLCNDADAEGRAAYPGVPRLAYIGRKSERAVQNDLRELVTLGLIREGDQRRVAYIPADSRPVVYDLAMAYAPERRRLTYKEHRAAVREMSSDADQGAQDGVKPTSPRPVDNPNHGVKPTTERGEAHFTQPVLDPKYLTPQPPAERGTDCSTDLQPHPNCRGCGTTRRALRRTAARAGREHERRDRLARPAWCGSCDPDTRRGGTLVEFDPSLPCPACSPDVVRTA